MEVRSIIRFARISPLKVHDLARAIRGMPVSKALETMQFSHRKGAFLLLKTLKSAVANAENNAKIPADKLFVKVVAVETGPSLKRFRPKARGMAGRIKKRMSHIRVVLAERGSADGGQKLRKESKDRGTEG